MRKQIIAGISVAIGAVVGIGAFVYSGAYDIGADVPHWSSTVRIVETVRDRSIHRRASEVKVPDLSDQQLILKGAGQYAAMCVNCHLAPGISSSEIRPGLYPQPPELSKVKIDPRVTFWVTKHGIKMSGMPAWGRGHDDATLWSIVAFVNKLPTMTGAQYKDIVSKAPPDEEMEGMGGESDGPKRGGEQAKQKDASDSSMKNMPGMR